MALNARAKGQRGEREVVKILQATVDSVRNGLGIGPITLQRNTLQAHQGGEDIHGLDGFAVEVKFCETLQLRQWWDQTLRQAAKRGAVPVLFYRKTKQAWACKVRLYANTPYDTDQVEIDAEMSLEDFLNWFEEAYKEVITHITQRLAA
jgi:hypothetical protein